MVPRNGKGRTAGYVRQTMTETNILTEIEVLPLTHSSSSATLLITTTSMIGGLTPGRATNVGGLLLVTATLLSSPNIETNWTTLTASKWLSARVAESHLLPDEGGYDARQVRRASLARLRAARFPRHEREQRVARALATLAAPGPSFTLDAATWKWIAEEAAVEDI